MRLADYLQNARIDHEFMAHAPAFSATRRAKQLHVPGRQVAKCVLLEGPRGYFLAVLPAVDKIDTRRLAAALGGPVRLAREAEVAATFRDCEWGVVPPFATLYGLPTVLEASIDPETLLIFEGQTHVEAIRLSCGDFERLERPRRLRFRQETGHRPSSPRW
jgi:Ala-tRNA(Pro) deacylase